MLTKENSGVTKETPAASREGRTDRVCRCGLKILSGGKISADVTEGINGDLHRFTGKSRMRSFHAPEDINCQISPGNLELELRRDVKSVKTISTN